MKVLSIAQLYSHIHGSQHISTVEFKQDWYLFHQNSVLMFGPVNGEYVHWVTWVASMLHCGVLAFLSLQMAHVASSFCNHLTKVS